MTPLEVSSRKAAAALNWGPWLALLLVIVGTASVRLRLLSMPLERDEGEYAYAGQLILRGIPPYERLYNMKWPGTYYSYALFEGVFGQTIEGIRLGVLLVNVAAIVLVFVICRRLLDAYAASAAAVAAYGRNRVASRARLARSRLARFRRPCTTSRRFSVPPGPCPDRLPRPRFHGQRGPNRWQQCRFSPGDALRQ